MEIMLLFLLILLNGVFAMSEIALITARKVRLQKHLDGGDPSAAAAIQLGENPTRFLSTIQIGITSISILNGFIGEATFAKPLQTWLQSIGLVESVSYYLAAGLVVIVITYFSIVLGELVPKRLGQINPELIAKRVALPMLWLATMTKPFVRLLSASTEFVLRIFGLKGAEAPTVTQEEIHDILVEGSNAGVIEHQERTMVHNVFRLDDRQITSLMVPRGDVVYLDIRHPLEENLKHIEQSEHSRFPVIDGDFDKIMGIATAKQLLIQSIRGEKFSLTERLQPAVYVPEALTGMELLENFRSSGVQLAFVIDEYGEVLGIVTLLDVMEAVTGEFKPRNVEDAWAVQRQDGTWLLDGLIPIPELKDRLLLKTVPEEDKGRYNTLSGMIMLLLGRLPHTGDYAQWEQWRFEVVDIDGKRIDKVLATKIPKEE